MHRQNRVDPFGALQAVAARGSLMGNRGILHDPTGGIRRTHAHRSWVTCRLDFRGRKQQVMAPGAYTQLFFLDEATAFAAGHRPCGECRRDRYRDFCEAWCAVHGDAEPGRSLPQTIDRQLHKARIGRNGVKITFAARPGELPEGTIFAATGRPVLVWNDSLFDWSFDGYTRRRSPVPPEVDVLTPAPIVALLRRGWLPGAAPE
ncbi:hypothetical protein LAZ40_16575 [Cereibacter sphaeroides]|uniref:hypothetical protein n=1 Tax=Cereibacter sphaeroides TaxID=1063 RepID=UPI001F21ED38|nr:hypothetical protein [Cereibacter sphaeroides]MCE6960642.1 hypothetical protein [Cereibacter sphaeroides]MCE6970091.1 hypothetical protein [Cereibacter sphaeroides]MCE6973256.1 hypothetical protein [Cereibacter sphaeroides]